MASFDNTDVRHPFRVQADGRLSRGLSLLVIGALSLLAWAVVIGLALAVHAVL